MMSTNRIGQALLLLGFCISAPNVFATEITSGSIQITGSAFSPGTFTLSGNGFTATGSFSDGAWGPQCFLCNPVIVAGVATGGDFSNGSATVGTTNFPNVNWDNFFPPQGSGSEFHITGPLISLNNGQGTYVGTFSFTGSLCGVDPNAHTMPDPCIVDLRQLTGSGLVSLTVIAGVFGGENALRVTGAMYSFVPEPSSIVLVASAGLIFLARRRRLNKRLA